MNRTVFREVVSILVLAFILAFSVNAISPRGLALVGQWDANSGVVTAKAKNGMVQQEREIDDILEAKAIYDEGGSVFVDARSREVYASGHVKGAFSFPVREYETTINTFIETYPVATPLIVYCSGRECEDSHVLATYLSEEGYAQVRVMVDGFPLWEESGFPVE